MFSSAPRTGDNAVRLSRIFGVLLVLLSLGAYLDPNGMDRLSVAPITRIRTGFCRHSSGIFVSATDSTVLYVTHTFQWKGLPNEGSAGYIRVYIASDIVDLRGVIIYKRTSRETAACRDAHSPMWSARWIGALYPATSNSPSTFCHK